MSLAAGLQAEERACSFLREQGFDIIDRNVHSRFGEIDIIALRDEVLHFIEVKSAADYGSAIQNITPTKLSRILRTVDTYLQRHRLTLDYVVDAVIVTPQKVSLVENITL